MIKKILFSTFLAVVFGLLILGAVNRTITKTGQIEPLNLLNAEGQTVEEVWVTKSGVIDSVNGDIWIVTLSDGESLELKGRMIGFLAEQGFAVAVNDKLVMSGFFEGAEFKIGHILNVTTGQSITIRDQAGHPLWAGNQSGRK